MIIFLPLALVFLMSSCSSLENSNLDQQEDRIIYERGLK